MRRGSPARTGTDQVSHSHVDETVVEATSAPPGDEHPAHLAESIGMGESDRLAVRQ
jgi:hypothetical protein